MHGFFLPALFLAALSAGQMAVAAGDAGELARLRAEIAEIIGAARCANLVQCRIAAVGTGACGGPAEYIVYSWMSTDKAALETKIAEYNFLQEDLQKEQQAAGACVELPEPVAACINGRCVLPSSH
ncbi:MAG TPA: hypothetical protein VF460_14825 [Burkholderiales bacterium]